MREVNYSIANANKASVGITTALYDRRALDCTSTLPLVNSLNHLAYLTTSSARIREILTQDGGIERLVCILKQGRGHDSMGMWKWNLAFQCVVNIGVRGTEDIRTRVVEADMVPVIATLLDSYNKLVEKCREKAEEARQMGRRREQAEEARQMQAQLLLHQPQPSFANRPNRADTADQHRGSRRQAPPSSLDISATYAGPSTANIASIVPPAAAAALPGSNPVDRTTTLVGSRHLPSAFHARDGRLAIAHMRTGATTAQPLGTTSPPADHLDERARANLNLDRQAFERGPRTTSGPTTPFHHHHLLGSQPASPTTPLPPAQIRSPTVRPASVLGFPPHSRRRPSIRHQPSMTVESDDANGDDLQSDESPDAEMTTTTDDGLQTTVGIQDITMGDADDLLTGDTIELTTPTVSETQDTETFNITHRDPLDGSINTTNPAPVVPTMAMSPTALPVSVSPTQPTSQPVSTPPFMLDRYFTPPAEVVAAMPRDEDILMSLQLLAYISKYCGLRSYFQQSHLVPRLKLDKELRALVEDVAIQDEKNYDDPSNDEEYLLPNDFNIFPLVEKFTVRLFSQDMQYWAGVVMRNLCRKDDTRGGIRQCAYYQCGKWEEYTRQFAKCRRCRRTKYCSKDCQKSAWAFHRHWCVSASS